MSLKYKIIDGAALLTSFVALNFLINFGYGLFYINSNSIYQQIEHLKKEKAFIEQLGEEFDINNQAKYKKHINEFDSQLKKLRELYELEVQKGGRVFRRSLIYGYFTD